MSLSIISSLKSNSRFDYPVRNTGRVTV